MGKRLMGAVGGFGLIAGLLAGCSDPAAEDTFAVAVSKYGAGSGFDNAHLVMPHRAVGLEETDVTQALNELDARDLGLGDDEIDAADGYEFVVLHVEPRQAPYGGDGSLPAVEITTEETAHDISAELDDPAAGTLGVVAVVSVPVDSPVALTVADEGKTATLDVRTGKPSEETTADSMGAYYVGWSNELSGELASTGVLGPSDPYTAAVLQPSEVSITLGFNGAKVSSQAWIKGLGWAPAGQSFMHIAPIVASEQLFGGGCYGGWDPATAITFTPDGGSAVSPVALNAESVIDLDAGMAFPIPADTKSGALTMTPQSTTGDGCQFYQPLSSAELAIDL